MQKEKCKSCVYYDDVFQDEPYCDFWGAEISEIEDCDEHTK